MKQGLKVFFREDLLKIKNKFNLANEGKENLHIVFLLWGGFGYLFSILSNKIFSLISLMLVKEIISIAISAYFIWHIFIIIKCRPKKELLSDEQIENLKKDRNKRIIRKLLLKEPITKWNPAAVCIAIDLYVIVHFLEVLVK